MIMTKSRQFHFGDAVFRPSIKSTHREDKRTMYKLGSAFLAAAYIAFASCLIYALVLFLFVAATVVMHVIGL